MCEPMMLTDEWTETAVHHLALGHVVSLLGRDLRVTCCRPSERGGDFWELEAHGADCGVTSSDVLHVTLDKNFKIYARQEDRCDDCPFI
jgi:hypothetical protein